jgi:AraC-like DNA-binding protein
MTAAAYLSLSLYQSLTAVIVVLLVIIVLLAAALVYMYTRYRLPQHRVSDSSMNQAEAKIIKKSLEKWVNDRRYREQDLSREDVALELNTSRELLNAYFSTVLHKDFNTWRTTLRVEDAKIILLENRELPINLVGEMVGFSDRSNFHRQFTKIAGCSPKTWRESSGRSA